MEENNNYIYTPLTEPIPITEQVWPEGTLPLVHTRTMTYMHENYIRDCIEGILIQKTTFPVQVLIHDDASTDKTAEIVREYEQKYPQLLKVYYQEKNSYCKVDMSERRAVFRSWKIGKYEALCEGDDYWTDPYKLQKQVDFLEANEDFSICFHPIKVFLEDKGEFVDDYLTSSDISDVTDVYTLGEFGNYIHTPSVMYRTDAQVSKDFLKVKRNALPGDYVVHLLHAQNGKIKKLSDIMAVYRVHKKSTWSSKSDEYRDTRWLLLLESLMAYFCNNSILLEKLKTQYARNTFALSLKAKSKNDTELQFFYFKKSCEKNINVIFDDFNAKDSHIHKLDDYIRETISAKDDRIHDLENMIIRLEGEITNIKNSRLYKLCLRIKKIIHPIMKG